MKYSIVAWRDTQGQYRLDILEGRQPDAQLGHEGVVLVVEADDRDEAIAKCLLDLQRRLLLACKKLRIEDPMSADGLFRLRYEGKDK